MPLEGDPSASAAYWQLAQLTRGSFITPLEGLAIMLKRSRETESFTVSFLDVASCGFGAMIILAYARKAVAAIATRGGRGGTRRRSSLSCKNSYSRFAARRAMVNRDLNAKQEQLSSMKERVARLRRDLSDVQGEFQSRNSCRTRPPTRSANCRLRSRRSPQRCSASLANSSAPENNAIGGIPVDSEYIIFVIDTSGQCLTIRVGARCWG